MSEVAQAALGCDLILRCIVNECSHKVNQGGAHIDRGALKRLSLVSRSFRSVAQSLLFRRSHLFVTSLDQVKQISRECPTLFQLVRVLVLQLGHRPRTDLSLAAQNQYYGRPRFSLHIGLMFAKKFVNVVKLIINLGIDSTVSQVASEPVTSYSMPQLRCLMFTPKVVTDLAVFHKLLLCTPSVDEIALGNFSHPTKWHSKLKPIRLPRLDTITFEETQGDNGSDEILLKLVDTESLSRVRELAVSAPVSIFSNPVLRACFSKNLAWITLNIGSSLPVFEFPLDMLEGFPYLETILSYAPLRIETAARFFSSVPITVKRLEFIWYPSPELMDSLKEIETISNALSGTGLKHIIITCGHDSTIDWSPAMTKLAQALRAQGIKLEWTAVPHITQTQEQLLAAIKQALGFSPGLW